MPAIRHRVFDGILIAAALAAAALTLHAFSGAVLPFDEPLADGLQQTPGGRYYEPIADVLAWSVAEYALLLGAALVALRARDMPLALSAILANLARLGLPAERIDRTRPSGAARRHRA